MALYLWIAIGSALGGMARFWCSELAATHLGQNYTLGTVGINIIGSFIIGFVAPLSGSEGRVLIPLEHRHFILIGLCGGFTIFSYFSLHTLTLAQNGDWARAGLNILLSVALCLLFVWLGHITAAILNQFKGA